MPRTILMKHVMDIHKKTRIYPPRIIRDSIPRYALFISCGGIYKYNFQTNYIKYFVDCIKWYLRSI